MSAAIRSPRLLALLLLFACGDSATQPDGTNTGGNGEGSRPYYAVYAIPKNYHQKEVFHVDACWAGAHITMMGFTQLKSGGWSHLHKSIEVAAQGKKTGREWHMSDKNTYWREGSKKPVDKKSPANRFLQLGTEKPSTQSATFSHVGNTLKTMMWNYVEAKDKHELFRTSRFHVTFDQCGSYGRSPEHRRAEWTKQVPWSLIIVESHKKPVFRTCTGAGCECHPTARKTDTKPWSDPTFLTSKDPNGHWFGQCSARVSPRVAPYNLTWKIDNSHTIQSR
ncbi:MAG: hypothetical protein P8R42_13740 [Candidatus Binatia bacterium]|nr:hypothetical protein [Candidatus Binatia bacterium]